jgi:phage gpG-like protein
MNSEGVFSGRLRIAPHKINASDLERSEALMTRLKSFIKKELARAFKILCQPNWLELNYIIEPTFKVNR